MANVTWPYMTRTRHFAESIRIMARGRANMSSDRILGKATRRGQCRVDVGGKTELEIVYNDVRAIYT